MTEERKNYGRLIKDAEGDVEIQRELVQDFVDKILKLGEDYGEIPGFEGKPTLFKAGAEKLLVLFGAGRKMRIVKDDFLSEVTNVISKKDWKTKEYVDITQKGCFIYEVECDLYDKNTGMQVGSGIGGTNSFEKKFASQGDCFQTQNNIIKMAGKRAMVDAALSLSLVSGMFTQDVEDMDIDKGDSNRNNYSAPKVVNDNPDDWIVDFGGDQFKGKALSSLPPASIKWYHDAVTKNIKEGKFVEKNKMILSKIKKVAEDMGVAV